MPPGLAEPPGPLLPVPDADGHLSYPTLATSVRESIQIILRTRPGERLMRPEFGGGLDQLLNEQNTLTVRQQIKDLVSESLQRWEPRILVDRIEVWEADDDPSTVRTEIAYRLKRTNQAQNVGITLALRQ